MQAVAETVIALTPGPVAEALIRLVGRNDKPILIAGVTASRSPRSVPWPGCWPRGARSGGHLVFWAMAAIALLGRR